MSYSFILVTILLILTKVPITFCILFGSIFYLWDVGTINLVVIATKAIGGLNSFVMLAIPFFILASRIMSVGSIASRIMNFATLLVGHLRGGLGIVNVFASMIFAGMSGTASGDAAGLGQIEIQEMIKAKYSPSLSAVITAMSSTIGPIIPPSVPFVIYGALTSTSVGKLFLGGAIPGIFLGSCMMLLIYILACRSGSKFGEKREKRAKFSEIFKSFKEAFLSLLTPIIIIGGIIGGVFTPTESAVIAVFYSLFLTMFVYKEITIKDLPKIIFDSLMLSSLIMIIVGTTAIFGWVLLASGITGKVVELLLSISTQRWIILLVINIVLLILGCFMEVTALLVMFAPLFIPIMETFHIDPVHFGVLLTLNLMIGLVTPPVGMAMYITCDLAKVKIKDFVKDSIPFYLLLIFVLLVITFFPTIVTFLPNLIMG